MSDTSSMQPVVKPIAFPLRLLVGVLSAVTLLSAVALLVAAVAAGPRPAWMVFGFEVCSALAGVIGVQIARRKFEDGQGLALLCVAGTVGVSAFLWWFSLNPRGAFQIGSETARKSVSLTPLVLARLGIAGVFTVLAAVTVLQRSARSWWYIGRAALAGGPVLVLGAAVYKFSSVINGWFDVIPSALRAGLYALFALAAVAAISICAHCVIRAFELARTDEPVTNAANGAANGAAGNA